MWLAVLSAIVFIPASQYRWVGHGIIGLTAFGFSIATLTRGMTLARRIKRSPNSSRFLLHRKFGIVAGLLVTFALAYGVWMVFARQFPVMDTIHGRVGVTILLLSGTQIMTGLFRRRKVMNLIHSWNGYCLVGLIGLQIVLGIFLSPLLDSNNPRYMMRLSTPPVQEVWLPDGTLGTREYFFTRAVDGGNYEISYRTDAVYVYVGLKVKTTGWVGVGIQPVTDAGMQNADIVFAYVTDNGQVAVRDDFGVSPAEHLPDTVLGGTSNILEFGGKEQNGFTIIEFKRPLVSEDRYDVSLRPGHTGVIWAYGLNDAPERHLTQGFFDLDLRAIR